MYLQLNSISKVLNGATVLENISYRFEQGKIYGLKGKNGCGKTMLLRTICGLILPTSGNVDINGKILHQDISFPESIGVLIENPSFLPRFSGYDNLKLLATLNNHSDSSRISMALQRVGLYPEDKRPYKKYSLGMKQRLGIACAIMEQPDIILLDEPINAIDEKGVELVRRILIEEKNRGAIILLACHDAKEMELLSDEILEMKEGRLCCSIE